MYLTNTIPPHPSQSLLSISTFTSQPESNPPHPTKLPNLHPFTLPYFSNMEKIFFWAACGGKRHHVAAMRMLLKGGMSVNHADTLGQTALHKAAYHGNTEIVELLLNKGADVNVPATKVQQTPLHMAVAGRLEPVLLGNVEVDDEQEYQEKEDKVVQLLLNTGVNVDAQDSRGRTVLHEAVWTGYRPIVNLLLEKGARTDLEDKNGNTALSIAVYGTHQSLSSIVIEATPGVTEELIKGLGNQPHTVELRGNTCWYD